MSTPITVAYGDGIGPEIMEAVLFILKEAKAKISVQTIEVGQKLYERGQTTGIAQSSWDILRDNKILLKAPITTPQGGGYKSLNVTMRKTMGLYANVRPTLSYHPFIASKHPKLDMVIIRENEEDLYTGIEHRGTQHTYQCLKLITREGCEKIITYAFDYALQNGRKKVTCMSKDNIMKMTDGLFHKLFNEIAACYPEIDTDHYIIDIGAARIAAKPEIFDVIVTLNLYGDIISDIAAEISGSVGLAGSANIGREYAMFEAIHGSAPDIAGKDIANPSGLLNAAIMMLVHIGECDIAEKIQNAWLKTLEDGTHTPDIYNAEKSTKKVGTQEFARAVVKNFGKKPATLKAVDFGGACALSSVRYKSSYKKEEKRLVGVDVFIDHITDNLDKTVEICQSSQTDKIKLATISSRGLKIWPSPQPDLYSADHWCLRFAGENITSHDIVELLDNCANKGLDVIKIENLYKFDDKPGYSLGQGE